MERLIYKREKSLKSLNALERSFALVENQDEMNALIDEDILLAAVIKHFELCYEMSWKFLKQYLQKFYGLKVDSPKKIFRECFSQNIIDEDVTKELLAISEARSATIHDYNEESTKEIFSRINQYFSILQKLEKIEINISDK